MHTALPGVDHADEGRYGRKWPQPHLVQPVYATGGHGQELSPAWRCSLDKALVGGIGWVPLSPERLSDGSIGSGSVGAFAYCLDRGNGQVTRLIPADVLPPLNEIPAREVDRTGMVVLPPLQSQPPRGVAETNERVTVKVRQALPHDWPTKLNPSQSFHEQAPGSSQASFGPGLHASKDEILSVPQKHAGHIAAMSIPNSKRTKVYCDKWIHEGVCAFTQQGCKFKHEMPPDEQTQRSLGLFQGLPSWWRKCQMEGSPLHAMPPSTLGFCPWGGNETRSLMDAAPKGLSRQGREMAAAPPLMSPPRVFSSKRTNALTWVRLDQTDANCRLDNDRPWSVESGLVPFIWGPIGTPASKMPVNSGLWRKRRGD